MPDNVSANAPDVPANAPDVPDNVPDVPPPEPDEMSDEEMSEAIDQLNNNINNNPELANNPAVQEPLNQINNQPTSVFKNSANVITTLNQVLPKFTDPNSNAEDYASGALQLTSSILYAASAIPGAVVITAPLGFLVGLVGAIVGIFGSKKQNLLDQITVIINDATDRQTSEQMQQELAGAYTDIRDRYITLASILADNSTIAPSSSYYNAYTLNDFTSIASDEIGAAIKNLSINATTDKKDNWDNTANTYFALSQVMTMKIMYISQGISFFNIRQDPSNGTASSLSSTLTKSAISIFNDYNVDAGPYIYRPNLAQAGITHSVFRLPEARFRLIGVLFSQLGNQFWPFSPNTTEYRFTDSDGQAVCRFTTSRLLHASTEHVLYNDMTFGSGPHMSTETTYFSLWADSDSNYDGYNPAPPRYRWFLQPVDDVKSLGSQELYIFEVNPTQQERESYKISDTTNSLLMFGDINKDHVWFSSEDKHSDWSRGKGEYAGLLSGDVNKVLWILLSATQ